MEHAAQLVSALAWPLTVVFLSLLFRGVITELFKRLQSITIKRPDTAITTAFSAGLDKIEDAYTSIAPYFDKLRLPEDEEEHILSDYERLLRIAKDSGRAAITEAWRDIEITTKKAAEVNGITVQHIAGGKAISELVQKKALPGNMIPIYHEMRKLRSRAAHAEDFAVDPKEVRRYIDAARKFHAKLLSLLPQKTK